MTLKTLKQKVSGLCSGEDRGVSPVIGIVLMVAITVVLAAVIGAFVLGMGDEIGGDNVQASLSFEGDADSGVTVSHNGGDSFEDAEIRGDAVDTEGSISLSPGESEDITVSGEGDLNVVVGDTVIGSYEVPSGTGTS